MPQMTKLCAIQGTSLEEFYFKVLNNDVDNDQSEIEFNPPSTSTGRGSKRRKKVVYMWHTDKSKVANLVPDFSETREVEDAPKTNPLEFFQERFWTEDWINVLCEQHIVRSAHCN